jgi:cytochrome P450
MRTGPGAPTLSPRSLPLLGYALPFARAPLSFVEWLRRGDDVLRFRLGTRTVYWVNNPELVRRVLVDAGTFDKGLQADELRVFVGNGLFTATGDQHRRHRRLVQPAFHRGRIAGYVQTIRELADDMTRPWCDGEQIDANRTFTELTLRVVSQTLFSTRLAAEMTDEVVRSVPLVLREFSRRIRDPFGLRGRLPTPANREFTAAIRRLRQAVDRIVEQYRASEVDHGDVGSMLLLARDEASGAGLSDQEITDEVLTLLAAGTDTTTNILAWAVHHLSIRPDLDTRAYTEVRGVLGDRGVDVADLPNLTFLRCVLMETLRMYPQAWVLTRRTTAPASLGGWRLPAGASVFFSPYAMQRDPAVYPRPDVFDPDRWADHHSAATQRPSFLPFGAGRRQCIGDVFAMTELTTVLATVIQHWRLTPAPGPPVRIDFSSTLKPDRLTVIPHRR